MWKEIVRRIRHLGRSREFETSLDDEIQFHLRTRAEELERDGLRHEEAESRARREFGPGARVREEARGAWRFAWLDATIANLRYGLRQLRKSPGFAVVAVATLALGIGANSAVFSAIDAVLLRPLPFPESDRLLRIRQRNPKSLETFAAPVRVEDWNRMNSTFQAITGYYTENASEISGELPEKLKRAWVAPRFLEVLGISPELGRDFSPEEEHFGGPAAVLISDRYWRRRFAADPNAIGRPIRLEGYTATVVGVLPASFQFPDSDVDLWWPVPPDSPVSKFRYATWYTTLGRTKPNVSAEQARADLAVAQSQLGRQFPATDAQLSIEVLPLKTETIGRVGPSLWLLFGSVTVLLLIACVNVAALLLVRGKQRQHELSIRVSLGATRKTIVAQLLTETLVLATAGGGAGLLIALGAARVFRVLAAALPRVDEIQLDGRVVAYTLSSAILVTVFAGLLPALRATRARVSGPLVEGSRMQVSGRNRLQWILVGSQVALAVMLLAGAGLLLRSFRELSRVSPGFETAHILTFHISGSYAETADYPKLTLRLNRTIEFLRTIPGVEDAATAIFLPGVPAAMRQNEVKLVEGRAESEPKMMAYGRYVSREYFATMRIPLLAGQTCDAANRTPTALVNRSFADAYFQDSSPIGHSLASGGPAPPATVRGIVGDAREQGLHRAPAPTVYWCGALEPAPYFVVRTRNDPAAMGETIRRKIHEIVPTRSVFDIRPLTDHLGEAIAENRLRAILLSSFAITAVLLACVGLYGTLSYLANVRRREVGLRLALGALRGQIVSQFLRQGLGVSLLACVVGLGLTAAFTQVLAGMLYGISPHDPLTLAGVAAMVLVVAALASLLPSMRASRVEPMQVLREE